MKGRSSVLIENLKLFMAQSGTNPSELALRAGLNHRAVHDILEGNSKSPRQSTISALAKALGVSSARLVGEDEDEPHDEFMRLMSKIDDPKIRADIQALVLRRLLEK